MPGGTFRDCPTFSAGRDAALGSNVVAPLNNFHAAALDTVANAPGYETNCANAQAPAGPGNYASGKVDTTPVGAFSTSEIRRFQNPYDDVAISQIPYHWRTICVPDARKPPHGGL
jgi:hypothetical protein